MSVFLYVSLSYGFQTTFETVWPTLSYGLKPASLPLSSWLHPQGDQPAARLPLLHPTSPV